MTVHAFYVLLMVIPAWLKARAYDDYQYMASKGVKWFAILDVSSLPLTLDAPTEADGCV